MGREEREEIRSSRQGVEVVPERKMEGFWVGEGEGRGLGARMIVQGF